METGTEPGMDMEMGSVIGRDSEMGTESGREMEVEVGSLTGTDSETGTEWETGTESEMEIGSRTEIDSDTEATKTKIKYYSSREPICRLSDPAQPHTLSREVRDSYRSLPSFECFTCKEDMTWVFTYRYHCATCDLDFHRGCHLYLPEIRHPFHLQHPLTITFLHPQNMRFGDSATNSSYFDFSEADDDPDSKSDFSVMKCKCCQRNLGKTYYACSICAFTLHLSCAKFSPPLTINHPKAHDHTLTLLPRKNPSPCDACGLSLCRQSEPVYACLLCNYMVHRRCIYLPRVIKITRHEHRLAYSSSLPPLDFSCGVCRKSVNINCGQYSCTVGCFYTVHSKCATRKIVWDGKELEGLPLEEEEVISPFTRIDDQTINHFNHEHDLRFHMNDVDYDIRKEIKFCQACVLPIIFDPFYSCMQCKFVLHEACATRALKIHHPLHVHVLSLVLMPPLAEIFTCRSCWQGCLGFSYKCFQEDCDFVIDARCISMTEPFHHKSHPHPLYFTLREGHCMRCEEDELSVHAMVECLECNSFLCLQCATLPDVAIYKHDKHPVTLCYGEENTGGTYWCEICEGELDATLWFYRCQECCLTLHISCVLGEDINMKPGHSFDHEHSEVNILPNSANSLSVCERCGLRCKDPQLFKFAQASEAYCSYRCMGGYSK